MPITVRIAQPGLSPRVRGNPGVTVGFILTVGSIPACAGEPSGIGAKSSAQTVYPRVCGGTDTITNHGHVYTGLSPRVRGNR